MISQFCPTLSKDLLKREFLNTAAAFAVLAVLGFAAGMLFPDAAQQLLDRFAAQLEQLGLSSNVPQSQMMATLFFNNVTASLLAMLYGLIPFVPLSALALGTNALLLGAFAALYQHHGIGLGVYFIGILPHGIFELPARTSHLPHGNGKTPQKERCVFPAPRAGLQPRLSILRRAAAARRRAR